MKARRGNPRRGYWWIALGCAFIIGVPLVWCLGKALSFKALWKKPVIAVCFCGQAGNLLQRFIDFARTQQAVAPNSPVSSRINADKAEQCPAQLAFAEQAAAEALAKAKSCKRSGALPLPQTDFSHDEMLKRVLWIGSKLINEESIEDLFECHDESSTGGGRHCWVKAWIQGSLCSVSRIGPDHLCVNLVRFSSPCIFYNYGSSSQSITDGTSSSPSFEVTLAEKFHCSGLMLGGPEWKVDWEHPQVVSLPMASPIWVQKVWGHKHLTVLRVDCNGCTRRLADQTFEENRNFFQTIDQVLLETHFEDQGNEFFLSLGKMFMLLEESGLGLVGVHFRPRSRVDAIGECPKLAEELKISCEKSIAYLFARPPAGADRPELPPFPNDISSIAQYFTTPAPPVWVPPPAIEPQAEPKPEFAVQSLAGWHRMQTFPQEVKSGCKEVGQGPSNGFHGLMECQKIAERQGADTVSINEKAGIPCSLQKCDPSGEKWSRNKDNWKTWRTYSRLAQRMPPAFDIRRDDLEVFLNTATASQKGPRYPLVTRVKWEGTGWAMTNWEPGPPPLPDKSGCSVGKVIIGIMSSAKDRKTRDRQRFSERHWRHKEPPLCISFVYVIGALGLPPEQLAELEAEIQKEDDIEKLQIVENMNEGKTYDWLDYALKRFPHASYIAKMDQDAFVHPVNLIKQLQGLPQKDLFYGFDCGHNGMRHKINVGIHIDRKDAFTNFEYPDNPQTWTDDGSPIRRPLLFMCGMFYVYSKDALKCAIHNPFAKEKKKGAEDVMASSWFVEGKCNINYAVDMYRFYDHGDLSNGSPWVQALGWHTESVCVHQLKKASQWTQIEQWLSRSDRGSQRYSQRTEVAISVPFRDREVHFVRFRELFDQFALQDASRRTINWHVYVIDQFDAELFNRGWLFNVGFDLAAQKGPDCVVIHDIDMVPENGVDYSYCEWPNQLSSEIDRFGWGTPTAHYSGGVVSMTPEHWRQVNGFPNDFFGWGGEDDDLLQRIKQNDLGRGVETHLGRAMKRPKKGKGRFSTLRESHTLRIAREQKKLLAHLDGIIKGSDRWKKDGIKQLKYWVLREDVLKSDAGASVTYHHVRVKRGKKPSWELHDVRFWVPASACGVIDSGYKWWALQSPVPLTLKDLQARFLSTVSSSMPCAATDSWTFIAVDLTWSYSRIVDSDDVLRAFLRQLMRPELGFILVERKSDADVKTEFAGRQRLAQSVDAPSLLAPPTATTLVCLQRSKGNLHLQQAPCKNSDDHELVGAFLTLRKAQNPTDESFCVGQFRDSQATKQFGVKTGLDCACKGSDCSHGRDWEHKFSFALPQPSDVGRQIDPKIPRKQVCVRNTEKGISIGGVSGCDVTLHPLDIGDWGNFLRDHTTLVEKGRTGCHLFVCNDFFLSHIGGRLVPDEESGNKPGN